MGDHKEKGWPSNDLSFYCVSKIGLCALTRIQQRQFDQDPLRRGILVNSVHPGYLATDMTQFKGFHTMEQGNGLAASIKDVFPKFFITTIDFIAHQEQRSRFGWLFCLRTLRDPKAPTFGSTSKRSTGSTDPCLIVQVLKCFKTKR